MIRAGIHYVSFILLSLFYCLYVIVFILLSLFYCHFLIVK